MHSKSTVRRFCGDGAFEVGIRLIVKYFQNLGRLPTIAAKYTRKSGYNYNPVRKGTGETLLQARVSVPIFSISTAGKEKIIEKMRQSMNRSS